MEIEKIEATSEKAVKSTGVKISDNIEKINTDIHIRIKQRNGRKCISIITGLNKVPNMNKSSLEQLVKKFRKKFSCSVAIKDDGNTVELQGDHRLKIQNELINLGICKSDDIKIHGS